MKNITGLILIIASIAIYFGYIKGAYENIPVIKANIATYDNALNASGELEQKVALLQKKVDAFDPADVDKLKKLLPDNADNVRLIIDINNIAKEKNMNIKNIVVNNGSKVDANGVTTDSNLVYSGAGGAKANYHVVKVSFNLISSYENFIEFANTLQKNLRIVDITNLTVKPDLTNTAYEFGVTLNTYWIK